MSFLTHRAARTSVVAIAAGALLAGCAGMGGGGSGNSINVLMVNNPQMIELQKLTAKYFTKKTGIKVYFTVLPENDVRDKISQDFSNQAGQYDVGTISNFEVPFFAANHWLQPLDGYLAKDPSFDQKDILGPMRESLSNGGKVYGEPFYGESSLLMYRKDVFAKKHLKMPAHPTWPQVAKLAAEVDGAQHGMRGICLRGLPGWGEMIAPLTTVVNTFGGTWFDKDWNAKLTSPAFEKATRFYVNLVRKHGEAGAAQSGYAECLNDLTQSKTAMWYDSTAAAGTLEAGNSPVKGKIGYVDAPVVKTKSSGWLYTWAWGIQKASHNADKAWKFISWASSKGYENLVGHKYGWPDSPAGKRASTYSNKDYLKTAHAFADVTHESIVHTNPRDPGVQKRPTMGIQFVDVPEFSDLGTKVSQEISAAIAGKESVATALKNSQKLADKVGEEYRD